MMLPKEQDQDAVFTLGAIAEPGGVHFRYGSNQATKIEVCLFDSQGCETDRHALSKDEKGIHSGFISGLKKGARYGLRAHGPWAPEEGHFFNPQKLLLDPHATEVDGKVIPRPELDAANKADSAAFMPKAVVSERLEQFDWTDDQIKPTPWDQTILYEAHVKGLTINHPGIPDNLRGSYEALGHPAIIDHLKGLGITALELLPVQGFADEPHLVTRGLANYWGYNPVTFNAPESSYFGPQAADGLKEAIRRLHQAGIEVILDLVYNHTGEGDLSGPCVNFRGLDNAGYYRLEANDPGAYVNDTGCGNTLDFANPHVCTLVLESLRHWVINYHVDGFRFDLAPVLGRSAAGFDTQAAFMQQLVNDPVLRHCKLIAEPWDIGPGGYCVGQFPKPFAEWNDRFRDSVRRFWRGDDGQLPELAGRLLASADLFDQADRQAYSSVNFITAHDGFTLSDLVSYTDRHNQANGEENRDGQAENFSSNEGVEGPTNDPDIKARRDRRRRNVMATLFLSQGTPMMLGGDELGNSQQGNNNAYCQDNDIGWLQWEHENPDFLKFVQHLGELRLAHAALRQVGFLHGDCYGPDGIANVTWLAFDGETLAWDDPDFTRLGLRLRALDGDQVIDDVVLVINGSSETAKFRLPPLSGSQRWQACLDTDQPDGQPRPDAPPTETMSLAGASLRLYGVVKGPA